MKHSMKSRVKRRALFAAAAVFLIPTLAACGGSDSASPKKASTSSSTPSVTIPSLPPQPLLVGDRAALGDWQLRVLDATIGTATIAHIELTNQTTKSQDAPPATLYELVDGTNSIPTVTAVVTEMPARLKAFETVTGTLTFTSSGVPKIPYLYWTGKLPNTLATYIALDESGAPQSRD
jgi:hypothetical protein